jgi:putative ABC transport system permease protein
VTGWTSTFRIALTALLVNKLRSFLTMLGIIIGVASVIAMMAVGEGASRKIEEQMASMGTNLLLVIPGSTTAGGVRMGMGSQLTLTLGDAEAIQRLSAVEDIAPSHNGVAQVVYGNLNWSTGIVGSTPGILAVRNWRLAAGRVFADAEVRSSAKVCLLGQTVVENLFGGEDPLGKHVRIKNVPFRVLGVLEAKGQTDRGDDQDDTIIVPLTTAQRKLFGSPFPGAVRTIAVKVRDEVPLDRAEAEIRALLRQRHRLGPKQDDDFSIRNLTYFMQAREESARVMGLLLAAVASVSLLVGGIGIMNIMFVTVSERTKEIGLRRSVGARRGDVRLQFLIEAVTLSCIGGLIGIALGVAASALISRFAGWAVILTAPSVLLAFSFSALVGIFFGFYPANKAALLNPIQALRHE